MCERHKREMQDILLGKDIASTPVHVPIYPSILPTLDVPSCWSPRGGRC